MALAKLAACTAGGAVMGGGAVYAVEQNNQRPGIERKLVQKQRAVKRTAGGKDAWGFTMPGSKGQNGQRGWCYPTHRSGNPRPTGFAWIELDLPIEEAELPLP